MSAAWKVACSVGTRVVCWVVQMAVGWVGTKADYLVE